MVEIPRNGRSAPNGRALTSIRNNAKNMEDTAARKKEKINTALFILLIPPHGKICGVYVNGESI
jgi:hypothetical protein